MDNKEEPLSDDIRDWSYQLDKIEKEKGEKRLVVFEEYSNTIKRSEDQDEEENFFSEEDDLPLKLKDWSIYHSTIGPVLVPEFTDPTKHFKLWTMYSKVLLTKNLLFEIENTKGIETIEALSPYRARIGIAPLFSDRPILNKITKIIHDSILPDLKN